MVLVPGHPACHPLERRRLENPQQPQQQQFGGGGGFGTAQPREEDLSEWLWSIAFTILTFGAGFGQQQPPQLTNKYFFIWWNKLLFRLEIRPEVLKHWRFWNNSISSASAFWNIASIDGFGSSMPVPLPQTSFGQQPTTFRGCS